MKSREEQLETLLVACVRLLQKESHYNAQVPKVLETDFNAIEKIVSSVMRQQTETHKEEEKIRGDLT